MEVSNNTGLQLVFDNTTEKISAILNDIQLELFEIVNLVGLSAIISLFGIVANVINITVFLKQGFANTVNISFLGLAISDLCCLIPMLWLGICLNPYMKQLDVPMVTSAFQYLTGACPHGICGRITSCITVYVTAERCLCILFPLKIKQLVTSTKTTIIVCSIFVINFLTVVPDYTTSYLVWTFSAERNKTLLVVAFGNDHEQIVSLVYILFFCTGFLSFVALVIFTVILVVTLQKSSNWRKVATSGSDHGGFVTRRERKTVKMIVVISTTMIVCYTPGAILSVTTVVEPEFYLQGRYFRLCKAMWSIACVFNSINSSINIFFYYRMSSNYRKLFRGLLQPTYRTA